VLRLVTKSQFDIQVNAIPVFWKDTIEYYYYRIIPYFYHPQAYRKRKQVMEDIANRQ